MKSGRYIYLFFGIIILLIFSSENIISLATNLLNDGSEENINTVGFSASDFLQTSGNKIVNQNGEEVVLRGYNLGLWLSRSFWGIPVVMDHNSNSEERYSPANSIEMDYELYSNTNLTASQAEELNELFYTNQITETDLDVLAETGVNVVRVPFEWSFFMRPVYNANGANIGDADYNNYGALSYVDTTFDTASEEDKVFLNKRLAYLEWIVQECGKRKIYVIFDIHVAPGGLNTGGFREDASFFEKGKAGEARRACALRIWKIVAEMFKNNPTIAGYDIVNEPQAFNNGNSTTKINVIDFYDEAYQLIRQVEEDCQNKHIIIMEGKVKSYSNSSVEIVKDESHLGLPNPTEKGWKNVIYSRHDYYFNFRNAEGDQKIYEEWEKDNPEIEIMKARIDNGIEEVKYTMELYNIPVWIGEFSCHAYYEDTEGNIYGTFQDANGTRYNLNKEYTDEIWKYQIQRYEENNISYTAWTYKACWEKYFGLVYYSRKVDRVDLKKSTYNEIAAIFQLSSGNVLRYNTELHNIIKKQIQIFEGIDISANGDGSVIAKLSSDKTILTISGIGQMADLGIEPIGACEVYSPENATVSPWYNYRNSITTVNIDENITNIGAHTFLNCKNLKNIVIPNTVTKIGAYAFSQCDSLVNIKIPNSVTNINMRCFWGCDKLTSVELGHGLSYIGAEVFNNCSNLKNIYVYASNENYTAIDGILYNKAKNKIIKYPEGKEKQSYIISGNVNTIENGAFFGCKLISLIIPDSISTIGENVFNNCSELKIMCKEGSYIEAYAIANNIKYVIDSGLPQIEFSVNGTDTVVISSKTQINVTDANTEFISGIDESSFKYYWGKRSEGVESSEVTGIFSKDLSIITPKQEGIYYLWILVKDNVGNETLQRSNAFNIDALAPIVRVENLSDGVVKIISNEKIQELNGWTLSQDKKILEKQYTENITEEVEVCDIIGNSTKVKIIVNNIDKVTPTIDNVTGNATEWTNGNVTLTVNATDSESGIASENAYSFDNGVTWQTSNSKTYIENTRGIKIKVKDNVGNVAVYGEEIVIDKIDKVNPTIEISPNGATVSENQNIVITAFDLGNSGLNSSNSYQYQLGNNNKDVPTGEWKTYISGEEFKIGEGLIGEYYVWIKTIKDNAGNSSSENNYIVSNKFKFDNILKDTTEPTIISVTGNVTNWTNQNVILKVEATDSESGIASENAYSFDNGVTWQTSNIKIYTENTAGIKIKVKDNAGNVAIYKEEIVIDKIDKEGPIISTYYSTEEVVEDKVEVKIISNEELKELNEWILSDDKKVLTKVYTENITEEFEVYDLLGNMTKVYLNINNIQKEFFTSSMYEIKDNYILNINPKTIYTDFIKQIDTNMECVIRENDRVIGKNDLIKTGQKLVVGEKIYELIVVGDINGDGKLTITDLSRMKLYFVGVLDLEKSYKKAADITRDEKISITDLSRIKLALVGLVKF